MISLDTNALLRWIVADDQAQHRRIVAVLKRTGTPAKHLGP